MKQRIARWLRARANQLDPPRVLVAYDPARWTASSSANATVTWKATS